MAERTAAPSSPTSTPVRARFDRFELDEVNARLLCEGRAVALAPTPFAVLCALVRHAGSLLTKNALLDAVWGHQFVSESVLKTVISELRTVLKDNARQPRFIETVSRRGYRFIAPTTAASAAASESSPQARSSQAASFVGRGDALSRLHANWDFACTGKRIVVWVAGEPGIGKTALIERFVAGLGDIVSIRGQCVEQYGMGEPHMPVLEALSELCRRDGDAATLLRAVAPTWLIQLPWLSSAEERAALRQELAGVGAERMLREMGEMLDRYTESTPLLLVTEDLHWSDRATIHLIDSIARRRGSARLMWLASFRLAEVVASDHPLNSVRHELRLHGLCEEIVLDPFSETEVAEYVSQRSPSIARDEAFVRALHERTDGVPLFVASVTSDVVARAAQRGADASAAVQLAKMAVPDTLAAIIDHYIAKLDHDQRSVLEAAAACGIEFRIKTISDALQRDVVSVGHTCDELVREQLWLAAPPADEAHDAREPPYSFRHALFRQVLYERTAPATRSELHRRIGSALERDRAEGVPVAAAELAMHFERGREPMKALSHYVEAAEVALRHFSPAECVTLTERGLALLENAAEGAERDALEVALATLRGVSAFQAAGVGLEAKTSLQRAYALLSGVPQHRMSALLLHELGFVLCMRADYDEALAVAKRAESLSSDTDDPVLAFAACTVHGEVDQLQGRPNAARTGIERGLAVADAGEVAPGEIVGADPRVTLMALLAVPLLQLGLVKQARARLEQAHARARQLAQPMARMVAIWCNALFEVRLGSAERVAALADEMQALVDKFGLALGRNACRWFRGWADARTGKPREGYELIREAYEANTRLGMLAGTSEVLGYAAEALLLAGDLNRAREQLDEALQVADKLAERVYLPQLYLIEAAIARARGQHAVVHASVRRAVAEARNQGAPWLELMALLELWEQDGATAQDRRALAVLVDRLPEATDTQAYIKARALLDKTKH
ncbi:MAG TPA: winged helix-turn-helix domain-containing protein [Casimicrobiaceae bacterium]|jgi:DNA-binding winged helix-turn-helix (wHTH) protein/tetratricopeptide (TPR) repeat protein